MYSDVMHRTQVLLGEREMAALEAARRRTGASRGELIRRAVLAAYDPAGDRSQATSARGRFSALGGGEWSSELIGERRAEAARER